MTDRETMQQALECIERLNMRGRILADFEDEVYAAINALRKALAQQPKQEPVAWMSSDRAWMWSDYSKAIAAVANIPTLTLIPLYAAPTQLEQEPVAWMTEDECDVYTRKQVNGYFQHDHIPLYTTPPQLEQEPVPKPS